MADRQIKKKKIKKLPEKVSITALALSLLFALAVFYGYLELYYPDGLKLSTFIAAVAAGTVLCIIMKGRKELWYIITGMLLLLLLLRKSFLTACQDITDGIIDAYNAYMYVPIKIAYITDYTVIGLTLVFLLMLLWVLIWNVVIRLPIVSALPALGLLGIGIVTNVYPGFISAGAMLALFFALVTYRSSKSTSYAVSAACMTLVVTLVSNIALVPLYNRFTSAYSRPLIDKQSEIISILKDGNPEKLMSSFLTTGSSEELGLNDDDIYHEGKIMLRVTSNVPVENTLYLRGFGGADYTGFSWVANDENEFRYYREEANLGSEALFEAQSGSGMASFIKVKYAGDETDYVYAPYYASLPEFAKLVSDNYLVKTDSEVDEYTFTVHYPGGFQSNTLGKYDSWVKEKYLDLGPLENSEILEELTSAYDGNDITEAVGYVKELLSDNYRYSTDLDPMPEGADYIEYFLAESKEGYCQHFASAAAMLLRYMGYPARYVTGYAIPAENFVSTSYGYYYNVPDYLSHAWIEIYFGSEIGWLSLDVTPGIALARPGAEGSGTAGAAEKEGIISADGQIPEIPYNYLDVAPEERDVEIAITLDFFDFVPIIIALVIVLTIVIAVYTHASSRHEKYRVARFNFSTDESRKQAIDRSFRALEFCVPARATDDDYSYLRYALQKHLTEEEAELYIRVLEENTYGNRWSYDDAEVLRILRKLRKSLIYSIKPVKQFLFEWVKCY